MNWYDTDNHGVITKGELTLFIDGKSTKVGVGDWYHAPAGVEHAAFFKVETDEIEFWFAAISGFLLPTDP